MEWDTVTVSAIFVLYEWFWFLASRCVASLANTWGKICAHVPHRDVSEAPWTGWQLCAGQCTRWIKIVYRINLKVIRGMLPKSQVPLTLPPFICIQTFPTKIPWPSMTTVELKHLDGGKAFFRLHATLMPATIIEPEMLKSNASSPSGAMVTTIGSLNCFFRRCEESCQTFA